MSLNPTLNLNLSDEYKISEKQLEFYKLWVGSGSEETNEAILENIASIWKTTKLEYHTYRCVQSMAFLIPKIHKFSAYSRLIDLYNSTRSVKIADIGCCFGQDIRKLIIDGIPPHMIYAIDVIGGYWYKGLELYQDSGSKISEIAIQRNISMCSTLFCDLTISPPSEEISNVLLNHSFDCISLKNVFHVLSYAQSEILVKHMGDMLKSGGFVMGICIGALHAKNWAMTPDGKDIRYLQSKTTLFELFTRFGFKDITIKVMQLENSRNEYEQSLVESLNDNDRVRLEFTATKA